MRFDIDIKVIRNDKQYKEYLSVVDKLMDIDPNPESTEGELLETLVILIEDYERRKEFELPETVRPVEMIKLRMQELDLKQTDLIPAIGDKATVSKILHYKRKLTYDMVGRLSQLLKIPSDLLIEKTEAVEH